MTADRRARVLGKMLGQYIGKEVIVVGRITHVNAAGNAVEMNTLDNTKINVTLPNPIDDSTEGIFEIWGTSKSRGTMLANQIVRFDNENCKDLDVQHYNDTLVLIHALNNKWKLNADSKPL